MLFMVGQEEVNEFLLVCTSHEKVQAAGAHFIWLGADTAWLLVS